MSQQPLHPADQQPSLQDKLTQDKSLQGKPSQDKSPLENHIVDSQDFDSQNSNTYKQENQLQLNRKQDVQQPVIGQTELPKRNALFRGGLYLKKFAHLVGVLGEGFYLIFSKKLYKNPNDPNNTRYVQYFCRQLGSVFNVKVQVHGEIARQPALWVSNHISWLDVAVLGSGARVFFLAKAEVANWPIIGKLARWGGTLFIRRGSGDSTLIREQIAEFLKQDVPVLFFPEATTTDGTRVKKVHGKLLAAAIEAQKPVQICLIAYVNQAGQLDNIVPFIGNQGFVENGARILQMPVVTAHLVALPSIDTREHTVDSLTALVQKEMKEGLAKLHQEILH
ncbi:1-acyl-sn-glycerol-3-phosphate acyltransferase [Acinetobacter marinus]|uniref:1-acyl-sn-glycerol-3-phosphate acyltransferase n=1 Tax=Acinetobacter marinus TaxID=281375 RepID=A0A1G6LYF8_9GAMM|nr:lysophospholipid acyltransferase family protein [Acinetobacter marinus]SDC48303.1 1-acyl-sn-glycerol-3-phosphate acyltransferase [Acinetobacter marinus]